MMMNESMSQCKNYRAHVYEYFHFGNPDLQSGERDLDEGVYEVLLRPDEVLQGSHDGRVHARQAVRAVHPHDVLGALPLSRHAVRKQQVPGWRESTLKMSNAFCGMTFVCIVFAYLEGLVWYMYSV